MPTQVEAELQVEDGNGGTRQLSVNDFGSAFTVRLDEVGDVIYVGEAQPGTGPSEPLWRIKKVDSTSVEWADGDTLFNNVWDDRADLTYS